MSLCERIKPALILLAVCSLWLPSSASTIVSAATGNFNAGATWVGGVVPGNNDSAVVLSGHTVTVTVTDTVGSICIYNNTSSTVAVLTVNASKTLLVNNYVHVHSDGVDETD